MFNWKLEEMKLYKERGEQGKRSYNFQCEYTTSKEDKIAFIDSMTSGKLSYVIELAKKLEQDKKENKVVVDQWNWVKTNSLIAWVKRTDKKYASPIINITYNYGAFYLCGISRNIQTFYKDEVENEGCFINDVFHKLLHDCADKERGYFLEHDEYSILKEKFRNRGFLDTFGVKIWDYSTGEMTIADENDNERPITMEEIKELVQKCEQVQALIEEITQKTNIVY